MRLLAGIIGFGLWATCPDASAFEAEGPFLRPAPTAVAHDVHLTYTRMVVDGTSIVARVRVFRDDAERTLRTFAKAPTLRIEAGAASDAVFADYVNARVTLSADGQRLRGHVIQSGLDPDAGEAPMWWYLVEFRAPKPVKTLSLRVGLLFDTFDDQRNVVTLLEMPAETRHSLYFASDTKEQVVVLGGK